MAADTGARDWRKRPVSILAAAVSVGALPAAHAGELAYGVGYMSERSDNIAQTATDARVEQTQSVLAGFAYRERTADLQANLRAQAQYRDYRRDVFEDGPVYDVDAAAVWVIAPQQFTWNIEDRYTQAIIEATERVTPENKEATNVLSTGPDYFARFDSGNTLQLTARYVQAGFETSNTDHVRHLGAARWLLRRSAASTWSFNHVAQTVRFEDDVANEDFKRSDSYIGLDVRPARSRFALELGATVIDRERRGRADGPLARLTWTRQVSSDTTSQIVLAREFSDATSLLLASVTDPTQSDTIGVPVPVENSASSTVFELDRADLVYQVSRPAGLSYGVIAYSRRYDGEVVEEDRHDSGGALTFAWAFSPALTGTVLGEYARREFRESINDHTETLWALRLEYHLSRNLRLGADALRLERKGAEAASEFIEHRTLLWLLYSTGSLFTPVIGR